MRVSVIGPAGKRGQIYFLARTDTSLCIFSQVTTNIQLADVIAKTAQKEKLTQAELLQLYFWRMTALKNFENTHYQNQLGVLTNEHMTTVWIKIKQLMTDSESRQNWELVKNDYRPSFAKRVDDIIQEIEQEEAAA